MPLAENALVEEILAAHCDATARFVALQFEHPMVPPDPDDDNGTCLTTTKRHLREKTKSKPTTATRDARLAAVYCKFAAARTLAPRRRCWFSLTCIETTHMRQPTNDLVRPVRLRESP